MRLSGESVFMAPGVRALLDFIPAMMASTSVSHPEVLVWLSNLFCVFLAATHSMQVEKRLKEIAREMKEEKSAKKKEERERVAANQKRREENAKKNEQYQVVRRGYGPWEFTSFFLFFFLFFCLHC
jgi:Zn-finger domain-containing protein